ncbi:hypothetical protein AXG93_2789s1180 [Marchantia polymorpha subsp. ruderalis]|uniref:NB-ARC domain-containing protein n=1 Tax=Marchantia polymorpha subsp. ruderalis TaxID=1480154 RepID=A0A176W7X9_MARPO|nr:hypothetical protein AXG93_2789s1180 [Marchantia polymorpha subsp. ruderalis]
MSLPSADSATAALRVNRLSDSIYELYKPGVESLLDIVFFHGLQLSHTSDAHVSTWRSRGSQKEVWPMTWLPEEFPRARILSVNYDACITTSAERGRLDLYCTAESLMEDLKSAKEGQHPWRPVILVGHSYGGLVIKQLCLHAHFSESLDRSQSPMAGFLNCVRGIFFYGTPHRGMSSFFSPNGTELKDASPLLKYVKVLCAESARLHQYFDSLRLIHKWSIAGVGESKVTLFFTPVSEGKSQSEMIVGEGSARYHNFTMEAEDHYSLCQPESRTSNTYKRLTAFIQSTDIKKVVPSSALIEVPKMAMMLHYILFEKVQDILRIAPAIALCGMGGIGKTTLAKLLFNKLSAEFEYTCFLQLPKGEINGDYMKELEGRVCSSMHHHGLKVALMGKVCDWTHLTLKRLLLVLDDIDNNRHVEFLKHISSVNNCANSRYIVTSRSLEYLNRCIVTSGDRDIDACVFNVEYLNFKSSKELFMSHAFPYPTKPSPSLAEWVDKIVAKCDGLPLTLEVMGSYLKKKDSESIWSQCFDALDEAENISDWDERLWAKLEVSYKTLKPDEKEIFLDAATFFNNSIWNLREAKSCWRVLYGYQDIRCRTLVDLCLVYDVGEMEGIQMHEQMRSLGMKLARTWGNNRICRTWTKSNVLSTSSNTNMKIEEVITLRLEDSMPLNSSKIGEMKKLRYLDSKKELMLDEVGGMLSKTVVLLRLRGKVNSLCDLVDRGRDRLAVLDLKAPLTCLPTTVSELRNLEILKFQDCLFEDLPETFGQLPRLRHLTFSSCHRLRSLPEAVGRLSELRCLELHHCFNFIAFPDSFVQLPRLESLIMTTLRNLQRLPEGFGNLSQLQLLIISKADLEVLVISTGGDEFPELPESFGRLARLQWLILDFMPGLQALPETFVELSEHSSLIGGRHFHRKGSDDLSRDENPDITAKLLRSDFIKQFLLGPVASFGKEVDLLHDINELFCEERIH